MSLLTFLMLLSCNDQKRSSFYNWEKINQSNLETAEYFLKDVSSSFSLEMNCPSGDCPEYVGLIMDMTGEEGAYFCTGSLFNEDHILTNSHCLRSFLKSSSCEDLGIFFKNKKGDVEAYVCSEIIHVNDTGTTGNPLKMVYEKDYGVFKISAKPKLENLNIKNKKILSDRDEVVAYVTRPEDLQDDPNVLKIGISKLECHYLETTYFTPGNEGHLSPFMALDGCEVKGGNSGSPLLTPAGEFVGLIHGGFNHEMLSKSSHDKYIKENGEPLKLGLSLSSHCLDIPELPDFFDSSRCSSPSQEKRDDEFVRMMSEATQTLVEPIIKSVKELSNEDKYLRWAFDEEKMWAKPVCLKKKPSFGMLKSYSYGLSYFLDNFEVYYNDNLLPVYRLTGEINEIMFWVIINEDQDDSFQIETRSFIGSERFIIPKC